MSAELAGRMTLEMADGSVRDGERLPRVSAIVGARNAADTIAACLESLRPECDGGRAEVIAALPRGDSAEAIVRERFPETRIVSVPGRPNLAELRGAAVRFAQGE